MRSDLRPLTPTSRFVGPTLTVRLEPGNQVDCLDALGVAEAGDVIVVDAAGETETSIWGGLMSGLCQMKGVVGAVIDGAMRDTDELRAIWDSSFLPKQSFPDPRILRIRAAWSPSRSMCRSSAPA